MLFIGFLILEIYNKNKRLKKVEVLQRKLTFSCPPLYNVVILFCCLDKWLGENKSRARLV